MDTVQNQNMSAQDCAKLLEEKGIIVNAVVKKTRSGFTAKVSLVENGKSLTKKTIEDRLSWIGWSRGWDVLQAELQQIAVSQASEPERQTRRVGRQSVEVATGTSFLDLETASLPRKIVKAFRRDDMNALDREVLSSFRFATDPRKNLIPIVFSGSEKVNTWMAVPAPTSGEGIAVMIKAILPDIPPSDNFKSHCIEERLLQIRSALAAQRQAELQRKGEPVPHPEDMEADIVSSDEYRRQVELVTKKVEREKSRLDELNAIIDRQLDAFSSAYRGEPLSRIAKTWAHEGAAVLVMSDAVELAYRMETREGADGEEVSVKLFERLVFTSDWAELIQAQYAWLMGQRSLRMSMPDTITNDPKRASFNFIDIDAVTSIRGEHPAWDIFLKRMSVDEAEVFKAFVYSVFDAENRGRQALYLYDGGYSGKSCALNAFMEILGFGLCAAVQKESLNNQFGFSKVWDKRLVIYPDNKNTLLIKSERFHQLLGGDVVDVEYKNRASFSAKLNCRVIAAGNKPLSIDVNSRNELTRVIPICINLSDDMMREQKIVQLDENGNIVRDPFGNPKVIGDSKFPKDMKDQLLAFLHDCKPAYERLCPNRSDIILPDSIYATLQTFDDESNDLCEDIVSRAFTVSSSHEPVITNVDGTTTKNYITTAELSAQFRKFVSKNEVYDAVKYENFLEYLRRKKIIGKKIRLNRTDVDGRPSAYVGIAEHDFTSTIDPNNEF